MDARQQSANNKRKIADEPEEQIEEFFMEVANNAGYTNDEIEKTRATLLDSLKLSSRDSVLLLLQTPLLGQMASQLVVGLVYEFINKLKNSEALATRDEKPRKRARYGTHPGNATTTAELADKILEQFRYKNLLDEVLPNQKEDFRVLSLEAVHCTVCDTTVKLGYSACPSKFLRHLYGDKPGTITAHMGRVADKKQNVKTRQSYSKQAEFLRSKLSQSEGKLGQDTFGMTSMLSKYHGVVSCLKEEAAINASVLPSNQIPLPISINLDIAPVVKSPARSRHVFVPVSPEEKQRYKQRFNQDCNDWIPFSKLLSMFGGAKRNNQSFSRDRERRPIPNRIFIPAFDNDRPRVSINEKYVFINVQDEDPTSYYGTIVQIVTTVNTSFIAVSDAPIESIKYLIAKAELVGDIEDSSTTFPAKHYIISSFVDWKIMTLNEALNEAHQIQQSNCCE